MLSLSRLFRLGALALAASFIGAGADADEPPRARLAIKILIRTDLRFGKLAVFGSGGVAVISPGGARTLSGGLESLGGPFHPSIVILNGTPGARFVVAAEGGAVLRSRHGVTLVAKHVTFEPAVFGRFDESGRAKVYFGAELRVPPSARDGEYVAEIAFSAEYLEEGRE